MPTINGTSGNDTLNGTVDQDEIYGLDGDDTINGGEFSSTADEWADDLLHGGAGNDVINGGAGNDLIWDDEGNDTVYGGSGDDYMYAAAGDDFYDGGTGGFLTGVDHIYYWPALAGIIVDLRLATGQVRSAGIGDAAGIGVDTLVNIESISGSDFDDVMTAGATGFIFYGVGGNDQLNGGGGDDWLEGGIGDDVLSGGAGIDTASYYYSASGVHVSLAIAGPQDTGEGWDTLTGIEDLSGSDHDDVLIGNDENNSLSGDNGNDQLYGGGGNDYLIDFFDGDNLLDGGDGDDVLEIISGPFWGTNQLFGAAGNDRLTGGSGDDTLDGGAGDDILDGDGGINTASYATATAGVSVSLGLNGSAQNTGGAGTDTLSFIRNLTGSLFADTLVGDTWENTIYGLAGNDTLDGGFGIDILIGGTGDDIYLFDGDAVLENEGEGTDEIRSTVYCVLPDNVENLRLIGTAITGEGNTLDNLLRGNEAANVIAGVGGSDKLYGYGGDDSLNGGNGDDYLYGLIGNDWLIGGAGHDRMYGGVGDDTYYVNDTTDFAYELAGEGTDQVISSLDHQLRAEVENLTLTGTALYGKGNELGNVLTGHVGANRLYGYGGDDTLNGAGGDDILVGAAGNDTLNGGVGYDKMYGGLGDDIFIVTDTTDFAYELVGEGHDKVIASVTHSLRDNIEELELAGTDDIRGYGNGLDNVILGNAGANLIYGRDGHDNIKGNGGNDYLYGENGNDKLAGGTGQDRFYGGSGADQFIFRSGDFAGLAGSTADRIMDFKQAEGDIIRLDGVDANSGLGGDQMFAFIGTDTFTGNAGELRYFQAGGTTYVQGDTNGDGVGDFIIRIDGLHTLGSGDFVL